MKNTLLFASVSIAIAVVLGAMGAHYLRETLSFPAVKIESWKTAVQYQTIHGVALLVLVALSKLFEELDLRKVMLLIKVGMTLFAGSIYLLTLNYSWKIDGLGMVMGPLTPLGGLCMISAWGVFVFKVSKVKLN